jgi:HD-GYP domain-containing protein (c-di-GMP phosphodiesterase class II)
MHCIITLLGEITNADLLVLKAGLKYLPEELTIAFVTTDESVPGEIECCRGYCAFINPTPESMQELFSTLPAGVGERIPFHLITACDRVPDFLSGYPISGFFKTPLSEMSVQTLVTSLVTHTRLIEQNQNLFGEVALSRKQKRQLFNVSAALTSQHDLGKLLDLILRETREVVTADAGSIYIREREGPGRRFTGTLRFKISQNDSVDIGPSVSEFIVPIDQNTIAGYVAVTGMPLTIDDVYNLDSALPYKFGQHFDTHFRYHMKSMLTVPLKNMAGTVVGVMQLMNKKNRREEVLTDATIVDAVVEPFTHTDQDFVVSIASLAAVSIERAELTEDIRQLFEGFLDSSIAAVDERDRVTSGHSRRVMGYAMALVDSINQCNDGHFKELCFDDARTRQFKFAALLHDIGKIGVPEGLLTKVDRLPKGELMAVLGRLDFIRLGIVTGYMRDNGSAWHTVDEVASDRAFIERINACGFLNDEDFVRLDLLRTKTFTDSWGERHPLLSGQEWESLSIQMGNLTGPEREIINSHAQATRRILSKIPWTHDLAQIPEIAAHHHEKLDGSGYPDHLAGDAICLESRILCVVDIFDALVAQDRPYKPAMPAQQALEILRAESRDGHLDRDVVEFFIDHGIWKLYLDQLPVSL